MTMRFSEIEGAGILEAERLVLRVQADINVGKYLVLRAKRSPDGKIFSGPIPAAFWFPTGQVKATDYIILYTKPGQRSEKTSESGPTSHFFYWGLQQPIWLPDFKPALILASSWEWPVEKIA